MLALTHISDDFTLLCIVKDTDMEEKSSMQELVYARDVQYRHCGSQEQQ